MAPSASRNKEAMCRAIRSTPREILCVREQRGIIALYMDMDMHDGTCVQL